MEKIELEGDFGRVSWELPQELISHLDQLKRDIPQEVFDAFVAEHEAVLRRCLLMIAATFFTPRISHQLLVNFHDVLSDVSKKNLELVIIKEKEDDLPSGETRH